MIFLDPEEILNQIEIRPDLTAADFGSGAGGFSIPLAKRLFQGMVYAIDIQEEPLSSLQGLVKAEKLTNIRTIIGNLEEPGGSKLKDESIDFVLMVNLLFQADNKDGLLREAKRVLKQGGKLLIIDWKKDSPFGPSIERVDPVEVKKLAIREELTPKKEINAGKYHWGILFEKQRT